MRQAEPKKFSFFNRRDKWYLGGGKRLLWAPPFPIWLNTPGFWDKAHYYNFAIDPVFTWTLLDERGNQINLKYLNRKWSPWNIVTEYSADGLRVREEKSCLPNDVLISRIDCASTTSRKRRLNFIAWTAQPSQEVKSGKRISGLVMSNSVIQFTQTVESQPDSQFSFGCALGISAPIVSYSMKISEGAIPFPYWSHTPFAENFHIGELPCDELPQDIDDMGILFLGLHSHLVCPPAGKKSDRGSVSVYFGAAPESDDAEYEVQRAITDSATIQHSYESWKTFFNNAPSLQCSDPYLVAAYYHRLYGLKLNTIEGNEGHYSNPAVCEGIGYFRAPISYSAVCHIFETRWFVDPSLPRGIIRTFLGNQRPDGGFRGYIDVNRYRQEMFYHANWGKAILDLHALHPDDKFLKEIYSSFVRYADYFDRERDEEQSGLYDIDNHYETGQEFMHRYTAVDPDADKDHWGQVFRLKGVDVTVYIYELKRALAGIAGILKMDEPERERWLMGAARIKDAILQKMWDPVEEMFFDVDPKTNERTGVKAATCFYPYMTDIVSQLHLPGFKRHLLNPKEFWTPFPVPSTSVDDPTFSADAEWKNKRMSCPWNGRVWPMTNSHIAVALAECAIRFHDPEVEVMASIFLGKFIRMMFFDADSNRPNSFEHYNPMTGEASVYRGVDDYQHSWINDLIIQYIAGVQLRPDGTLRIRPLKTSVQSLSIQRIPFHGHWLDVSIENGKIKVHLDGDLIGSGRTGREVPLKYS